MSERLTNGKRIRQFPSTESSLTSSPSMKHPRRDHFALFTKILLNNLKKHGEVELLSNAKKAILLCTRRNSAGDPSFMPLAETTSRVLLAVVGEVHWKQAQLLMRIAQRRADRRRVEQLQALQSVVAEASLRQRALDLSSNYSAQSLHNLLSRRL